jgi:hypothetical protein
MVFFGASPMKEIKHKAFFYNDSVAVDTASNTTIVLDTPGVGKSNFLVGAIFHHSKAGMSYQVDYGLSKDLSEAGNIQTEAVKEETDTIVNSMQQVTDSGADTVGIAFGEKGIKLTNDNIRFLYAQNSVGTETSILKGVDIYYCEDDS